MLRPVIRVLAGVNGAGKSSVGGHQLQRDGLTWFNPDTFAREFMARSGCDQPTANALAWQESMRRLDAAIARRENFAFETTLGGKTVTARLLDAAGTHEVMVWFCGLFSAEHHIARVKARVAAGGHPIPEEKIRERYPRAQLNLIQLMPHLAGLKVYDNSAEAGPDGRIPDPLLLLEMYGNKISFPPHNDLEALERTPEWARPTLAAAFRFGRTRGSNR